MCSDHHPRSSMRLDSFRRVIARANSNRRNCQLAARATIEFALAAGPAVLIREKKKKSKNKRKRKTRYLRHWRCRDPGRLSIVNQVVLRPSFSSFPQVNRIFLPAVVWHDASPSVMACGYEVRNRYLEIPSAKIISPLGSRFHLPPVRLPERV